MFEISGTDLKSVAALEKGLEEHGRGHFGACKVTMKDYEFPCLQLVRIDLSGGHIDAGNPPPVPVEFLEETNGIKTERLEIEAHPLDVEGGGQINLRLTAHDVELRRCTDAENHDWLAPHRASHVQVEFEIDPEGIQSLFLGGVLLAAKQHGVNIRETNLKLSPHGANNVEVEAMVVAKKIVKAKIILTGRMRLDAKLQANFSDLSCRGHGALGHVVSAFMGPKLRELENRPIPLLGFRMGDIRLQGAKLTVRKNGTLKASANFGK